MEIQTIRAKTRPESGKGVARKLRAAGLIPAVAYGAGGNALTLALDPNQLVQLHKSRLGWNHPVTIEVEDGEGVELALLREVQKHPISRALLHADFLRVDPGAEVVVRVPLRVDGRAAGEEIGGRISQPRRELLIRCKPLDIPEQILVDVRELEIGDKVMLSELDLAEGSHPVFTQDVTVASCIGRRGGALDELQDAAEEDAEGAEDEAEAEE
jgi:large subunit ribosomal protein L25